MLKLHTQLWEKERSVADVRRCNSRTHCARRSIPNWMSPNNHTVWPHQPRSLLTRAHIQLVSAISIVFGADQHFSQRCFVTARSRKTVWKPLGCKSWAHWIVLRWHNKHFFVSQETTHANMTAFASHSHEIIAWPQSCSDLPNHRDQDPGAEKHPDCRGCTPLKMYYF